MSPSRIASGAGLALIAGFAPVAAQVGPDNWGPDSPVVEAAARAALPNMEVRQLRIEVRTIPALSGNAAGTSLTVTGQTAALTSLAQTLQTGGLDARVVGDGVEVSLPGDVLFDFDKASLRQSAIPTLEKLGQAARSTGDKAVRVEGHTDAVGTPDYNQRLSVARAEAVAGWLRNAGVAPGRIASAGFGATRPVAPNKTATGADDPAGRQRNRRVTVTFSG